MPVGRVVRHEVDDYPYAALVGRGEQPVEVRQGAEDRVDVAVVGHVVSEVGHRRAIERRDPDRVYAERIGRAIVEVAQMRRDAGEIADAVAI